MEHLSRSAALTGYADLARSVGLDPFRILDAAGVSLAAIEVRRPTLDDVFLTMTGRSLREDA